MSVTFGFYDAVQNNGTWDREYTAEQLSSIFDGLINDGVYESIGNKFAVSATNPNSRSVTVGIGRAWFNHTWTLNDAPINRTIKEADASLDRIDAICIRVDSTARTNEIVIIMGPYSSDPPKPTPENTSQSYSNAQEYYGGQMTSTDYPIAYIKVIHQQSTISQANIENAVGTSVCPYVTGLLEVTTIDQLVAQWNAQWDDFVDDETYDINSLITNLTNQIDQITQHDWADPKPIIGENIVVPVNAWATYNPTSGTEEWYIKELGYTYRAKLTWAVNGSAVGILETMRPYITWSLPTINEVGADILNQYACTSGGVYIYATSVPSGSITALTVECRYRSHSE